MKLYWLARDGGPAEGPYEESEIIYMWQQGEFVHTDMLCMEGTEDWQPASVVLLPPQQPSPAAVAMAPPAKRSGVGCLGKTVVALLGASLIWAVILSGSKPGRTSVAEEVRGDSIKEDFPQLTELRSLGQQSRNPLRKVTKVHVIEGSPYRMARFGPDSNPIDLMFQCDVQGTQKYTVVKELVALLSVGDSRNSSLMTEIRAMQAELNG